MYDKCHCADCKRGRRSGKRGSGRGRDAAAEDPHPSVVQPSRGGQGRGRGGGRGGMEMAPLAEVPAQVVRDANHAGVFVGREDFGVGSSLLTRNMLPGWSNNTPT